MSQYDAIYWRNNELAFGKATLESKFGMSQMLFKGTIQEFSDFCNLIDEDS